MKIAGLHRANSGSKGYWLRCGLGVEGNSERERVLSEEDRGRGDFGCCKWWGDFYGYFL